MAVNPLLFLVHPGAFNKVFALDPGSASSLLLKQNPVFDLFCNLFDFAIAFGSLPVILGKVGALSLGALLPLFGR